MTHHTTPAGEPGGYERAKEGRKKPIRVFYSDLTGRFFASQQYTETVRDDGTVHYRITGDKYDVTQDIANAIVTNDLEFVPVEDQQA